MPGIEQKFLVEEDFIPNEAQAEKTVSSASRPASESQSGDNGAMNGSGRQSSTPVLKLDPANATPKSSSAAPPLSLSPLSSRQSQPRNIPVVSPNPSTSLGHDRGYSLRRSIFTRNISSPEGSRGSAVELQPITQLEPPGTSVQHNRNAGGPQKKPTTTVTISSTLGNGDDDDMPLSARPIKKTRGLTSLPNYEAWVGSHAVKGGFLEKLQGIYHQISKRILHISETPQSTHGREIDFLTARQHHHTDERTGRAYIDNTIRSSRYTPWNFIPKQLYAQFSKLANFYFLCVSILQMIPGLSTTGSYTTVVPLLFFVSISMAKEGYDDLRRSRLDKIENNKTISVLRSDRVHESNIDDSNQMNTLEWDPQHWVKTKWRDIRVGDIVRLERNEAAPADLALLRANGPNGIAYVETMVLDGETNLKTKQPPPPLAKKCQTTDGLTQCQGHFVVEDPNLDLYKFEGQVTVEDQTFPLTNNEVVYRGSVLRNTTEAFGMVLYTGEECKIRMNATKNPRTKAPALQAAVNRIVIIIVIFVIALAIFNTIAYQIWQETTEEKAWYLIHASVAFFPDLTSFIIMFNTMIPLSLYVSLEIVKVVQIYLMNDVDMYDETSNTPMEPRTSTINEDLGQVSYIFSDKTGTLTNNEMRFRKMSVAGTAWLHEMGLQDGTALEAASPKRSKGKQPVYRKSSASAVGKSPASLATSRAKASMDFASAEAPRKSATSSYLNTSTQRSKAPTELHTGILIQYIQRHPDTIFARRARFLILSMALCHTCLTELSEDGHFDYQAASPDELALVKAAGELGFMMVDRQSDTISVKTYPNGSKNDPVFETYQILDVIEFSSKRKRMSIIVRMPNNYICIFTKGADSAIAPLLRLSGLALDKAVQADRAANMRKSLEVQEVRRRNSEQQNRKESLVRKSLSTHRTSFGGIARVSSSVKRLRPIHDEVDGWLNERAAGLDFSPLDRHSLSSPLRSSLNMVSPLSIAYEEGRPSLQHDLGGGFAVDEALILDDAAVFETCFQQINDFATEGLRTLLYGFRYLTEREYEAWKNVFLDASTALVDRQRQIEKAGDLIEKDFELCGATAIEDKLQAGVPETIEKLRRAEIKLWMLTGDKRETAINIGHSCRMIKDYSHITILDHETGEITQQIAAVILEINSGTIPHSVVVIDGQTLAIIEAQEVVRNLFVDLATLVDTVICCRASPSQKASLVSAIRRKVKQSVTLAIGDGANDIAMIQEAHVGIGITGKEGLQAARISDYSIAQFRFLLKLLLVHGRWNYMRTCKYTLGTFWKEMLFYLTQALYQRYAGYTGTSLYESWSLSMFNTLFTSLPVIFLGIFEKDLAASTLLAVPELYTLGQRNGGFNLRIYLGWVFMAASEAMVVFFTMLGLFGQVLFTQDNGLYAMGSLTFTACVIVIGTKIQFLELNNKSITCVIAMFLSIGGWYLWMNILSGTYHNNSVYDVKHGFWDRFGRNPLWWLTLILIVASAWIFEIGVRVVRMHLLPSDVDAFQELEKDKAVKRKFDEASKMELWASLPPTGKFVAGDLELVKGERTIEEQERREGEVQELLNRPRVMTGDIAEEVNVQGVRRRHSGSAAKQVGSAVASGDDTVDYDNKSHDHGHELAYGANPSRKSTDVQSMLKRGFGSIRRSLEVR